MSSINLNDYLKKLSGVRWFIILDSTSGNVVAKSSGLPDHYVEPLIAISKYSVDLSREASKYITQLGGGESGNTIFVRFDNEGLEIDIVGEKVVISNIDYRLLDYIPKVLERIRKNNPVKCSKCGYDLTLEITTCSRCGRNIPFISNKCPFCGNDTSVKTCPNHGGYVDFEGRVVSGDIGILILSTIVGIVLLLAFLLAGTLLPKLKIPLYGLGIAISSALIGVGVHRYRVK